MHRCTGQEILTIHRFFSLIHFRPFLFRSTSRTDVHPLLLPLFLSLQPLRTRYLSGEKMIESVVFFRESRARIRNPSIRFRLSFRLSSTLEHYIRNFISRCLSSSTDSSSIVCRHFFLFLQTFRFCPAYPRNRSLSRELMTWHEIAARICQHQPNERSIRNQGNLFVIVGVINDRKQNTKFENPMNF